MKRHEIALLLPGVFQRTAPDVFQHTATEPSSLLGVLLTVMEALHVDTEAQLDELDSYLDPDQVDKPDSTKAREASAPHPSAGSERTGSIPLVNDAKRPDPFLPFLARWVDKDCYLSADGSLPSGQHRLRDLVRAGVRLSQSTGTQYGLEQMLTIATGVKGFNVIEDETIPFHIKVTYPAAAEAYRALIEQIVVTEKPAYVTHQLCRAEKMKEATNEQA
jgi:hypothetical protein